MISEYVKAGMPIGERGRYPAAACVKWWIDRKNADLQAQLDNLDWKDQEVRLKRAKADAQEMENAKTRGELITREDVRQGYVRVATSIRNRFLAMPTRVAPRVVACRTVPEAKQLLDNEVYTILDELSRFGFVDQRGPGTSSPADRKPVGGRKKDAKPRSKRRARKVGNVSS